MCGSESPKQSSLAQILIIGQKQIRWLRLKPSSKKWLFSCKWISSPWRSTSWCPHCGDFPATPRASEWWRDKLRWSPKRSPCLTKDSVGKRTCFAMETCTALRIGKSMKIIYRIKGFVHWPAMLVSSTNFSHRPCGIQRDVSLAMSSHSWIRTVSPHCYSFKPRYHEKPIGCRCQGKIQGLRQMVPGQEMVQWTPWIQSLDNPGPHLKNHGCHCSFDARAGQAVKFQVMS